MSEWKEYKLGELCDFQSGTVFPNDYQGEISGDYPFIKVSDMNLPGNERIIRYANNWINEKTCRELRAKIHPKDATVFAKIGVALTYNRRRLLKQPSIIDNNMMSAIACDNVIPLFLYYLLCTLDFNDIASGTAVPYININDLKRIHVKIPPLPEQRAIASVLSSLDDKIDLLHRENKTLEAMAEALFRQWFIEEADEGWEEVKLGDFFPVVTGKRNANFATSDGSYPFFTCSQSVLKAPSYSFNGAAILLAGNGDFNIKHYIGKFEAYQRTYVLMPYDTLYFGFLLTLMKYYLFDITKGYQGSVIDFITKPMIEDFVFLLPKRRDLIKDKLVCFNDLYRKVDVNIFQLHTLEKLRDTLLPKLMSGEVRVKYEEEGVASCRA